MAEIDNAVEDRGQMILPQRLFLEIVTDEAPVAEVLQFVLDAVVDWDGFKAKSWQLDAEAARAEQKSDADRRGAPSPKDISELGEGQFAAGFSVFGRSANVAAVPLARTPNAQPGTLHQGRKEGWRILQMCMGFSSGGAGAYAEALDMQVTALRVALEKLPIFRARITRVGDREMGIRPPFGAPDVVVAALRDEDISKNYTDPAAFRAAWHSSERIGEVTLVSRNREWVDDDTFNLGAYASSVALARAAEPGKTDYFLPLLSEEEEEALNSLLRINQVGYNDKDHSLEFAVILGEGEHLGWADIYTILTYLEDGADDGSPVETVRVTFIDRATAEAEASLLRDMGVIVQHYEGSDVVVMP